MLKKLNPRECARPYDERGGLTVLACLEPGPELLQQIRDVEEAQSQLQDSVSFYLAEEDCLDVLRQSYQVAGTPTFILFLECRELDRRIGRLSGPELVRFATRDAPAAEQGAGRPAQPKLEHCEAYDLLRLPREMTLQRSQALKRDMTSRLLEAPSLNVVLDLSQIAKMDSSGLGVLVHWNTQLASHGKAMHLYQPSQPVRKCLDIAALSAFFRYLESEEDLQFLD